jgi:two-component system response regulator YesN
METANRSCMKGVRNRMNKVVLVDDEHFVRKGILALVDWQDCGFEVCAEASNGEDALEIIEQTKPDLVITDIRMPVLDGLELIRHLVEDKQFPTKFIILSGYNDFKYAQKAVRYGVVDFILKPLDQEEIEIVLKQLTKTLDEERKVKEYRQNILVTNLFEDLVLGNIEHVKEEQTDMLRLDLVNQMNYLIIEINEIISSPIDRTRIESYKTMIGDAIYDLTQVEIWAIREHELLRFGLTITDNHLTSFDHNIFEFVSSLQKNLQHELDKSLTIYIGQTVNKINQLNVSFESAIESLQYKYMNVSNQPVMFDKVKDLSIAHMDIDDHLYTSLMESIEEKDKKNIQEKIDLIFSEFQVQLFAPGSIKASITRCVNKIIKTIRSMEGNEQQLTTLTPMLHLHDSSVTFIQLKKYFSELVLEACEYICSLRKKNGKGDIYKIKAYIEGNFNENISLKSIASAFYMNPVYMGQLFKKTYGVYFKEFLLQLRIDESKKLLRQTTLRVYEIAEKVGFRNSDYFVTQFEKQESMTPTEYRKSLERNG